MAETFFGATHAGVAEARRDKARGNGSDVLVAPRKAVRADGDSGGLLNQSDTCPMARCEWENECTGVFMRV